MCDKHTATKAFQNAFAQPHDDGNFNIAHSLHFLIPLMTFIFPSYLAIHRINRQSTSLCHTVYTAQNRCPYLSNSILENRPIIFTILLRACILRQSARGRHTPCEAKTLPEITRHQGKSESALAPPARLLLVLVYAIY